jgi:asparagine synthase (glutamine-hydrolysing)
VKLTGHPDFHFMSYFRIKENSETAVSDEDFSKRAERWSEGVPDTKEAYFIRDIFDG